MLDVIQATNNSVLNKCVIAMDSIMIAEDEIAKFLKRRKKYKEIVDANFLALQPSVAMQRLSPKVYRHHCKELLFRMRDRKPLEPATKAEILTASAEISCETKLNSIGYFLYYDCILEMFGNSEIGDCTSVLEERDKYRSLLSPQEIKNEYEDLSSKVGNKDRKLKLKKEYRIK